MDSFFSKLFFLFIPSHPKKSDTPQDEETSETCPPKVPTPWAKYVDMMGSHHANILVWILLLSLTRRYSYT